MIKEINETKSHYFENVNREDKLIATMIRKKRKKLQIINIKNEKGDITDSTYRKGIQMTILNNFMLIIETLDEMNNSLKYIH